MHRVQNVVNDDFRFTRFSVKMIRSHCHLWFLPNHSMGLFVMLWELTYQYSVLISEARLIQMLHVSLWLRLACGLYCIVECSDTVQLIMSQTFRLVVTRAHGMSHHI